MEKQKSNMVIVGMLCVVAVFLAVWTIFRTTQPPPPPAPPNLGPLRVAPGGIPPDAGPTPGVLTPGSALLPPKGR